MSPDRKPQDTTDVGAVDGLRKTPKAASAMAPFSAFSLAVSRVRGTVVVTVRGDLEVSGSEQLGQVLGDLIDGQGNLAVVVDLTDATSIDPMGMKLLVEAANRAYAQGGRLTISEAPDAVLEALETTELPVIDLTRSPRDHGQARAARRHAMTSHPSAEVRHLQPTSKETADDSL